MSKLERVTQQHCRPSPGGKAGPRRMPSRLRARSGMAPVLVTRGRYLQRSLQEFDRFHGFWLHPHD
jgi:hypothetical protein